MQADTPRRAAAGAVRSGAHRSPPRSRRPRYPGAPPPPPPLALPGEDRRRHRPPDEAASSSGQCHSGMGHPRPPPRAAAAARQLQVVVASPRRCAISPARCGTPRDLLAASGHSGPSEGRASRPRALVWGVRPEVAGRGLGITPLCAPARSLSQVARPPFVGAQHRVWALGGRSRPGSEVLASTISGGGSAADVG